MRTRQIALVAAMTLAGCGDPEPLQVRACRAYAQQVAEPPVRTLEANHGDTRRTRASIYREAGLPQPRPGADAELVTFRQSVVFYEDATRQRKALMCASILEDDRSDAPGDIMARAGVAASMARVARDRGLQGLPQLRTRPAIGFECCLR